MGVRYSDSIQSIGRPAWQGLVTDANPFLSYDFLRAVERCGAAAPPHGWRPRHCTIWEKGELRAAAPLYVKNNSHGEFVFDWAWADAYHRHGYDYYPKLLCAVPFTPVHGPRLLVARGVTDPDSLRVALVRAILEQVEDGGYSSAHFNFVRDADADVLERAGLLARADWQFHWHNRDYDSFDDFLAELSAKKRKNIRQERRRVRDAAFEFERVRGSEANDAQLRAAFECYQITFYYKGNTAVLTEQFFADLARASDDPLLLVLARRGGRYRAAAILICGGQTLYGRYWGCYREHPALHFETCYYQGLEYCIEQGLRTFEPGAQGPHKIARGFLPTRTRSYHHIAEPAFRQAIARHLTEEADYRRQAGVMLEARSPFRKDLELDPASDPP